jgi:hypothetical protein
MIFIKYKIEKMASVDFDPNYDFVDVVGEDQINITSIDAIAAFGEISGKSYDFVKNELTLLVNEKGYNQLSHEEKLWVNKYEITA